MIKKVFDLFIKVDKPLLGRWSLKSCSEISTSIKTGIIAVTLYARHPKSLWVQVFKRES